MATSDPTADKQPAPMVAIDALAHVVESYRGQHRPGQDDMAAWVAQAIADSHHLICQAGTGIGKSFGYLVPAITSGKRVIVTTSTKTLQDQIAADLPQICDTLAEHGHKVTWSVVKGRGSYLCPAKLAENHPNLSRQGTLDGLGDTGPLKDLVEWWHDGGDGERDHAPVAVDNDTWSAVSVSGIECPGTRCSYAKDCPAMEALKDARDARLVICNHHLYGNNITSDDAILGSHDAVVFDEAHRLEDSLCSSYGVTLTPGRFAGYAGSAQSLLKVLDVKDRRQHVARLWDRVRDVETWLKGLPEGELTLPIGGDAAISIHALVTAVQQIDKLARSATPGNLAAAGQRDRTSNLSGHLQGDLGVLTQSLAGHVCWIEAGPVLRTSPISISGIVADELATKTTCILTSATLTVGNSFGPIARRLGFTTAVEDMTGSDEDPENRDPSRYMTLDVESPFDYPSQARIYLPTLPEPNTEGWGDRVAALTNELVTAAGGRALILCTSNAAVRRISHELRDCDHQVLTQGAQPRATLLGTFRSDPTSVLVATMSFWEGVDIVGDSCQLVLIDRVPFPRPDDPLWRARRNEATEAGVSAFATIDLPRAASITAQGAGRLIRSIHDEGMIVLCDRRIQTKSYGRVIINTLPEMPIVTNHDEAIAYLRTL